MSSIVGSLAEIPPSSAVSLPTPHPAAGEARARPPLRLAVAGLGMDERGVLLSILQVLEQRTERRWRLSDETRVDLLLRTRDDHRDDVQATLQGAILRDGDVSPDPDGLVLQLPLRVMSVLDTLNAACDRLRQHEAADPIVSCVAAGIAGTPPAPRVAASTPAPAAEIDDDKALASALARMIERRPEQTLRVRIVGHGTLYVCGTSRTFCIDFAPHQLLPALQQHRFVMTSIAADAAEFRELAPTARPIDEALWSIGMAASWERQCDAITRFRLRRWPDLARLPHRAGHIQACAALAARAMGFDDLGRLSGLGTVELGHFLHACELCGVLETVRDPVASPALTEAAARAGALTGLFDRLRRRFGL